ncbi:hypothetical protein [Stigmatella aurantiaca]|uniref:hypothetical protein n=1 Tax=Stigmatella aurantiaca TaxID=41 RepID=UPI0002DFD8C5|nr:hypothetical protein [Stigmatella aurantiaca]
MSRKRQVGAAVLGVCALAVLGIWLGSGEAPAAVASPPPPPMPGPRRMASEPDAVAAAPSAPERPVVSPPAPADPAAPVIDEITVEKSEVCEGEENLISLRAHTPNGKDAFLHYSVGGRQGQRIPVRSWIADDGEAPKLEVKVFGPDGKVTVADVPPFTVKPCKPARSAFITARVRANTWSEFEFEAKLVENAQPQGGVAFQPRSYEWTFGDGETAVTQTPYALHSYEGRKQDTMFSHLLVEVRVRGDGGEPVVGRTALQLVNPAFEDLATKGVVTLLVQFTPRFPELGSDGVVRQKVRLFHHQDRPVFIHNALRFRHRMAPTEPTGHQVVDPSALLGASTVPPGRGLEFEIQLDTRKEPDVFSMEYSLEGKDSEGRPVRGAFSVMRPPARPTRENSHPVEDPLLKAKILEARKLLNRPYVTDEDLWQLQRQGKFADLEARAQAAQGTQRPEEGREVPAKDPGLPPPGPTAPPGALDGRTSAPPKPRAP